MVSPELAGYIPHMNTNPVFDPNDRRYRFRQIPVRMLVPNVITLLAIAAGLTAIRLASEGRFEWALGAIVFAAFLDGLDGRVARLIKGQSRFGAELDSLADFVNFGVAPGLLLYFWQLHVLGNVGWIVAILFAICGGLRLARFNAAIDKPGLPAWAGNFFTGVPAPAGAITVLLPVYAHLLGVTFIPASLSAIYTIAIALLMVSQLPVFSGKKAGKRVPREMVLPIFVGVVMFIALLVSYPWHVLSLGALAYLASLPFGWLAWRRHVADDLAAHAPVDSSSGASSSSPSAEPAVPPISNVADTTAQDAPRPPTLN